jgi:hypothetical protein
VLKIGGRVWIRLVHDGDQMRAVGNRIMKRFVSVERWERLDQHNNLPASQEGLRFMREIINISIIRLLLLLIAD